MTYYVKVSDGTVAKYPYTLDDLCRDNPDVSFPREPSDELWAEYGAFPVAETPPPAPEQWKYASEIEPVFVNGEWKRAWEMLYTPVPQEISPLQARRALRVAGLKAQVDAYVATLSEEQQETWEYANSVRRDNEILTAGAAALGISELDMDNLFRLGETL